MWALATPFGGIVVSNQPFDLALAQRVNEIFTEVLIGPSFTEQALELLKKKKNRRLLAFDRDKIDPGQLEVRRVFGGLLLQQSDPAPVEVTTAKLAASAEPVEAADGPAQGKPPPVHAASSILFPDRDVPVPQSAGRGRHDESRDPDSEWFAHGDGVCPRRDA